MRVKVARDASAHAQRAGQPRTREGTPRRGAGPRAAGATPLLGHVAPVSGARGSLDRPRCPRRARQGARNDPPQHAGGRCDPVAIACPARAHGGPPAEGSGGPRPRRIRRTSCRALRGSLRAFPGRPRRRRGAAFGVRDRRYARERSGRTAFGPRSGRSRAAQHAVLVVVHSARGAAASNDRRRADAVATASPKRRGDSRRLPSGGRGPAAIAHLEPRRAAAQRARRDRVRDSELVAATRRARPWGFQAGTDIDVYLYERPSRLKPRGTERHAVRRLSRVEKDPLLLENVIWMARPRVKARRRRRCAWPRSPCSP